MIPTQTKEQRGALERGIDRAGDLGGGGVLWPFLEVVGPLVLLTGLAGILQPMLLTTHWVAVIGGDERSAEWRIDAPQKPSGKRLLAILEAYLTSCPSAAMKDTEGI